MQDLIDALADLTETLREDGYSENVVTRTASDYGVNPALLARKFEEKTGKAPAEFKAKTHTELRNMRIETAIKAAIEEDARYRYPEGCPRIAGKGFKKHDGTEFIAVTISTRGLVAIRVQDGAVRIFGKGYSAPSLAAKFGLI